MKYQIRPANREDIENVIELAVEVVNHSASPYRVHADIEVVKKHRRDDLKSLYNVFHNPDVGIFIAESIEGKFLGHIVVMLNNLESSTGEKQGYVFDVSVVERYQGLGIGKNLMETAEEFCLLGGMPYMCLNVTSSNESAVNFYYRLGYEEERKRMVKVIKPAVKNHPDGPAAERAVEGDEESAGKKRRGRARSRRSRRKRSRSGN